MMNCQKYIKKVCYEQILTVWCGEFDILTLLLTFYVVTLWRRRRRTFELNGQIR